MVSKRFFDALNLIKTLNFNKIWNIVLIYTSYKLKKVWGMPYAFSLEPTTSCNLRCPECPSGLRSFTRDTGHIDKKSYEHYINQYSTYAIYLTLYFQGEPYLNPLFLKMVAYAKSRKLYVSTSTNAHYLSLQKAIETVRSGLDRLVVSIDGTTQETYEQYRIGGRLSKVKEGLQHILDAKKMLKSNSPYVIIQFLVVQANEHQIEEIIELGKDFGVDEVKLKTAQIYDYKNGNPLIPTQEKYSRYIADGHGGYKLKYKLQNDCWRMLHSNVVTWDGKIVPCCFDKDAKYQMGDLNTHTLSSIWKNKKYQQFRQQLLSNRQAIDICVNCTEGNKIYEE